MKRISLRVLALVLALPLFSACTTNEPPPAPTPPPVVRTLTVTISQGTGGTVDAAEAGKPPAFTNCATRCTATFSDGAVVTLTAKPATSYNFSGWGVSCTPSNQNPCQLTMNQDRTEVAVFSSSSTAGIGDTFALTSQASAPNRLVTFNRATPGTALFQSNITNIPAGETLVGIAFSPFNNNLLYGISRAAADNSGRVYLIDKTTAVATLVAKMTQNFDGKGNFFGVNFDPFNNVLRVISDSGQDLSVSVGGTTTVNPALPASNKIVGLGITNGFKGTGSRKGYAIDSDGSNNSTLEVFNLDTQARTSAVAMSSIVPQNIGFNINAVNGQALVAFNLSASTPVLRQIDLSTGALSGGGNIGVTDTVRGLAIPGPAEPQVFAICESATAQPSGGSGTATKCDAGLTLYSFPASNPGVTNLIGDVSGMGSGETVLALAVRPASATSDLIALGSSGKLYTINPVTAVATNGIPLSDVTQISANNKYSMRFDPTSDTIRIEGRDSASPATYNVNILVNPTSGAVTKEGALQPTPFKITAIAHDNGTSSLFFYALDSLNNRLYTINNNQNPATGSPGQLTAIGPLGITIPATAVNGMDYTSGGLIAAIGNGTTSTLYSIDKNTGAASVAPVTAGTAVIGSTDGFSGQVSGLAASIPVAPAILEYYAVTATVDATDKKPHFLSFAPTNPGHFTRNLPVTGLQPGELLLGIDVQLDNTNSNVIYVLGSSSRVYKLNLGSAAVTALGAGMAFTPALDATAKNFGFQFDPAQNNGQSTNTLRIVTDTGTNTFVNSTTGLGTGDAALFLPAPSIHATAYTQRFSGAAATTLFAFDQAANPDQMMVQGCTPALSTCISPDLGYVAPTTSNLGSDSDKGAPSAFDIIGGHDGLALYATQKSGFPSADTFSTAYVVDLTSGSGTPRGTIGTAAPSGPPPGQESRITVRTMAIRFP